MTMLFGFYKFRKDVVWLTHEIGKIQQRIEILTDALKEPTLSQYRKDYLQRELELAFIILRNDEPEPG